MRQFKFKCEACFDASHLDTVSLMSDTSVPIYLTFFKDQFPPMMVCGCPCGGVIRKCLFEWSHPQSCGMYFITDTVQLHAFYIIPDDLQSVHLGNTTQQQ